MNHCQWLSECHDETKTDWVIPYPAAWLVNKQSHIWLRFFFENHGQLFCDFAPKTKQQQNKTKKAHNWYTNSGNPASYTDSMQLRMLFVDWAWASSQSVNKQGQGQDNLLSVSP